jgi:hypothetical protein
MLAGQESRHRRHGQELATAGQLCLPGAIGEQSAVADTDEARRHTREEEAAEELLCPQFPALCPPSGVSLVAKAPPRPRRRPPGHWQWRPGGGSG